MRGIEPHPPAGKWVIIHGHFYQPPRENPWLNRIEVQPSAAPHHDWNERIYAECYRPNGYSRLLDPEGMITGIHNNYADMSFNFGPTLMSWLRGKHPVTSNRIIEGDRVSAAACNGHGNAVAQVYNHIIMPLASRRDQLTQIRWAKASFTSVFNRDPEGIWLAETAINMETVQCLIDEKITFVILAPQQAEAFRPLDGQGEWISTGNRPVDSRQPYRLFARNAAGKKTGGHLDVFFFDEGLSKEISFNNLLQDAGILGNRINECYSSAPLQRDEVVVIATDGETFGHHKPFGDMCLAYFFTNIAPSLGIRPVNFGTYLALHRPHSEVRLKNAFGEGTAWSCAHGVGRWTRDCGCSTGGGEGWHQKWRAPLRQALDNLQEPIDEAFVNACAAAGLEPWELRNRYCAMFEVFTKKKWDRFLARQKPRSAITPEQSNLLRRRLEAQKYMLFSYTSCGWFFSEISGIEPMQNLAYACRALQLGIEPAQQPGILERLMEDLAAAPSNIGNDTGASLFERHILPFFFHEKMLGFAAAIQAALAVTRKSSYEQYGFHYHIETLSTGAAAEPKQASEQWPRMFHVRIDHPASGEGSEWLIIIDVSNRSEPTGWVLPWKGVPPTDMEDPVRLNRNPHTQLYTLADVFPSLRDHLAAIYLEKISRHSLDRFNVWLHANEQDLTLLQSFYPSIPDHFRAPLLFRLQSEWDSCFLRLEQQGNETACIEALADIQKRATHFNGTIGYSKTASFIESLLTRELTELSSRQTIERCDRIRYLLNAVDRFSLPVSKHRLEDMFFPVLSGPVAALHREVISAEENNRMILEEDKRELLIKLLNFAHRMNFNTDRYPLP
jgi:alpha-amylase/alpha-mannosidase (GH57 family)